MAEGNVVLKLREECKKSISANSRENVDYEWILDHIELFGRDQLVHRVAVSESYQLRTSSQEDRGRKDGYYGVGWVMNGQSSTCMICDEPFYFFTRRKHHCRVCGFLICDECSPHQIQLGNLQEETKYGGSRICSPCFALHEKDPEYAKMTTRDGDSDKATQASTSSLIMALNSSLMSKDMSFLLKENPSLLDQSTNLIERMLSESMSDSESEYSGGSRSHTPSHTPR
jgi:hypothetical protein